jgi:hypothetical protein
MTPALEGLLPAPAGSGTIELMHNIMTALSTLILATAAWAGPSGVMTDRPTPLPLSTPVQDDAFLFAVFGDRTGGPPEGVKVLVQAVADTNLIDPDLVMTVGDLVQGYNTRPLWLTQMTEFRTVMDALNCPWFPVAGNHDVYWRGPGRPAGEHESDYEAFFGPLWYAFDHKGCRFIVLYTDEGDPATDKRSFSRPEAQRMSAAQRTWLQETLDSSAAYRHVFVFCHHPRWRGGQYGDDWETVHTMLRDAGNVSAVFAGHVHQLRHDGSRDGIEYLTLATVGGHLPASTPAAGHLDHINIVMVRDEGIAMATVPVGGVIDPRAMTVTHQAMVSAIMAAAPRMNGLTVSSDGVVQTAVPVQLTNPANDSLTWSVSVVSDDPRWQIRPDHLHETVAAGESVDIPFQLYHPGPLDADWALPRLESQVAFADDAGRWNVSGLRHPIGVRPTVLTSGAGDGVLHLTGGGASVVVPSASIAVPDGPLTIETWVRPENLDGRRGLIAKTESSEYGLFASDWKPSFSIHIDDPSWAPGAYREVVSGETLSKGVWHHVAGVFDGQEARLYVDGQLVGSTAARGTRTRNTHPLIVGGDVDRNSLPTSCIAGQLDDVRLSTVARYEGERFTPASQFKPDADTVLLLPFNSAMGPFAADASQAGAHGVLVGGGVVREGVNRD